MTVPYRSLKAFCCSSLAALGSGALLGHVQGTMGPPNASQLEVAAAALARCPWVAQALAAAASLGMPFVEETVRFKIGTHNQAHKGFYHKGLYRMVWNGCKYRQTESVSHVYIEGMCIQSARIFQDTQRALGCHSTPGVK